MISIIYGAKGSGKTKEIIDRVNKAVENAKGEIVFITDNNQYTREIKLSIRYVDCQSESIKTQEAFISFIKGMLAANHDIEHMYIDGISRITNSGVKELKSIFDDLVDLTNKTGCDFTLTISAELQDIPDFISKHII